MVFSRDLSLARPLLRSRTSCCQVEKKKNVLNLKWTKQVAHLGVELRCRARRIAARS